MAEDFRKALISTVLNIFETMFFTFLEPLEGTDEADPPLSKDTGGVRWLSGEVPFSGVRAGRLFVYLPWDLGEMMTQNFLGLEEGEVTEEQVSDMARELANMVCGNLFSSWDNQAVISLGTPNARLIAEGEKKQELEVVDLAVDFAFEDKVVTVALRGDAVPAT